MTTRSSFTLFVALLAALALSIERSHASTVITYQGHLSDTAGSHSGLVDLEFRLYTSPTGCCAQGPLATFADVPVENGLFQVDLDFGDVYTGDRWLEVRVDGIPLEPRQKLTAAPIAVRALGPWVTSGSSGIRYEDASVAIGTTPNASNRLRVQAAHGAQNALNVADHEGITRLRVAANGGVAAGTNQLPPAGGLRVGTQAGIATEARQQLSVGSRLDLYSGAPNNPTAPSIRANPGTNNLVISAIDDGALFFNFDSGSGGVRFHNGTGSGGELMRLTGTGQLGIGTTSPSAPLHVNGAVQVDGHVTVNGAVFAQQLTQTQWGNVLGEEVCRTTGATSTRSLGLCSSTMRLKDAVEDFESARLIIGQLAPVRFQWKESGRHDIGLIAEQVEPILPELVTYNADGEIAGVNYRHLTAVLVKALQEQQAENDELRARLDRLEGEADARLTRLEKQLPRDLLASHAK